MWAEATMKIFADEDGDFVSREMFVCSLALCYEYGLWQPIRLGHTVANAETRIFGYLCRGNTEDRISYIFTMYGIIYGLER
jgi:hypothetical protein